MPATAKRKAWRLVLSVFLFISMLFPTAAASGISPVTAIDSIDIKLKDIPILKIGNPKGSVRWERPMDRPTSPVIDSEGIVYIGENMTLHAVYPDGTEKWTMELDGWPSVPVPGEDGTIYVSVSILEGDHLKATILAIGPDGKKKWQFALEGSRGLLSPEAIPAIGADGTIYVGGTSNKKLYALRPNGTKKWEFVAGGPVSPPSIGKDGTIYAGATDGVLYALAPNGKKIGSFATPNPIYQAPVIGADGTLYVGASSITAGAELYAIGPDGSKRWNRNYETYTPPAIGADGTLYMGAYKGLLAVRPDGSVKWSFELGGRVRTAPAIAPDGTIYAGSDKEVFYALNPDSSVKWEYAASGVSFHSPKIADDGTVYMASSSALLALGTVPPSSVNLDKKTLTLQAGTGETLKATVVPENAANKRVKWSSSNGAIAEVDNAGTVTGKAQGTAKIIATTEEGGFFDICTVTVTPAPAKDPEVPDKAPGVPDKAPEVPDKAPGVPDKAPEEPDKPILTDIGGRKDSTEIMKAVELDIVRGYSDRTFRPDGNVTRAEFASMLMRGVKPEDEGASLAFKDNKEIGAWAVQPVRQAVKLGIINGYKDGTFRPNDNITHAEMISMVIRASGMTESSASKTGLTDDKDIPKWARPAVSKAEETGIIIVGGLPDGKFAPQALSTRAEAASAIVRMLEIQR
ncbi:PQQ-binding-like beta-propeller repeat protein [Cohnella terricola]|nr:PQQ-binding-like beta-propeller repeat protein [Cohnella terricola]